MSDAIGHRAETVGMIRASAASLLAAGGGLQRVRAWRWQGEGFDRALWRQMVSMGWLGLRLPESAGGSGLGMLEACALTEELGAGLASEPLVAAAHAAALLSGSALAAQLSGASIVLPAWQEGANALDAEAVTQWRSGRLNGCKRFVPAAAAADAYLVSTQAGIARVARGAPGVVLGVEPSVDGGHFGTLTLTDAPAELLDGVSADQCRAAIDEATLATAACLLGVMERSFALTLDYLRTRSQFGRAIGSFQVLQHRMVDLKIQIALTRASVESAARTLDAGAAVDARRAAVSLAKARAADAAMLVTRQAVQLHGAIGYTDELDVGLYLRKAMVLANLYGSAALHRARYAAAAGVDGE